MKTGTQYIENLFSGFSLIIGSLLLFISSFFWNNGEYNMTGGCILIVSMVFWAVAFTGIFKLIKAAMPVYGNVGLLLAIYSCIGGASFGYRGIFSEAFDISRQDFLKSWADFPLAFNISSFWAGPLFPLSLLVLSIVLIRIKVLGKWAGILYCIGAVAFPISRIPRIEIIAHLADLFILIPSFYLGWVIIRDKTFEKQ